MNIKEVKDLIHEVLQSDITEFELEQTGTKIKLRRGFQDTSSVPGVTQISQTLPATPASQQPTTVVSPSMEESAEEGLHIVTSPIVGTFYRAPSPGAEPFAKIGAWVEEGSVLCIVEAMKLMNEIPSDMAGVLTHIYVDDGRPVEFGQKLFAVRPRK
jgi:acetyl-CoA carboxylase biotin carboxyl carrier protein